MSLALINRSPDLQRLRDEGYNIGIFAGHLVMREVPYVNAQRAVLRGTLISVLQLNGDRTDVPTQHLMLFAGEHPCDRHGNELVKIKHGSNPQAISDGLVAHHSFSSKPDNGYRDYYEKMTTYANMLGNHAQAIDSAVSARTYPVVLATEEESVFRYLDTASSRAGIAAMSAKLAVPRLAIIGVGGTGAYVLDLLAKTPVGELHLFDGDDFLQHNAFRAPGAPTIQELEGRHNKAAYFAAKYDAMRRKIVPHSYQLTSDNVQELHGMSFVFLCIDKNAAKRPIIAFLQEHGIPFIDVGIGVNVVDDALQGQVRVTTSTPAKNDHLARRIGLNDLDADDAYHQNIQIADLNAFNAALAVIRYKRYCGFYHDLEHEHHTTYTIDGNNVINEVHP